MKPVNEMTEAEKEQVRAWIRNWEKVGPILERLRFESIRNADTKAAIAAFDGAFESAIRHFPPKPYSGLVDFEALLGRARR